MNQGHEWPAGGSCGDGAGCGTYPNQLFCVLKAGCNVRFHGRKRSFEAEQRLGAAVSARRRALVPSATTRLVRVVTYLP